MYVCLTSLESFQDRVTTQSDDVHRKPRCALHRRRRSGVRMGESARHGVWHLHATDPDYHHIMHSTMLRPSRTAKRMQRVRSIQGTLRDLKLVLRCTCLTLRPNDTVPCLCSSAAYLHVALACLQAACPPDIESALQTYTEDCNLSPSASGAYRPLWHIAYITSSPPHAGKTLIRLSPPRVCVDCFDYDRPVHHQRLEPILDI